MRTAVVPFDGRVLTQLVRMVLATWKAYSTPHPSSDAERELRRRLTTSVLANARLCVDKMLLTAAERDALDRAGRAAEEEEEEEDDDNGAPLCPLSDEWLSDYLLRRGEASAEQACSRSPLDLRLHVALLDDYFRARSGYGWRASEWPRALLVYAGDDDDSCVGMALVGVATEGGGKEEGGRYVRMQGVVSCPLRTQGGVGTGILSRMQRLCDEEGCLVRVDLPVLTPAAWKGALLRRSFVRDYDGLPIAWTEADERRRKRMRQS